MVENNMKTNKYVWDVFLFEKERENTYGDLVLYVWEDLDQPLPFVRAFYCGGERGCRVGWSHYDQGSCN